MTHCSSNLEALEVGLRHYSVPLMVSHEHVTWACHCHHKFPEVSRSQHDTTETSLLWMLSKLLAFVSAVSTESLVLHSLEDQKQNDGVLLTWEELLNLPLELQVLMPSQVLLL